MELLKAVLLGIVQGLTEFLPISSSGHLVVVEHLLKVKMPGVSFEACVHLGTFFSVAVIYWKKIGRITKATILKIGSIFSKNFDSTYQEDWRFFYLIILGSIPAAILGLTLRYKLEIFFSSVELVAIMLAITGIVLWLSGFAKSKRESINLLDAIVIGLAQGIALLPGISRSGMTITAGIFRGVEKKRSADFSFLLSLPAILGASIYEFSSLGLNGGLSPKQIIFYIIGGLVAFVFGYFAIKFLLKVIQKGRFKSFAFYCFGLAIFILLLIR